MKVIATNKHAYFEYDIKDKFDAGIVLQGSEVKSIRNGSVSLNGSFIQIVQGECYLKNAFIKNYEKTSLFIPLERQPRKLLLHKNEIIKLFKAVGEKGMTIVPLKVYFDNKNRVKIEMALGKGKKIYDKRETLKQRDLKRESMRELKTVL